LTGYTTGSNGEMTSLSLPDSDRDQLGDATWPALFE
jgi:hypothetical protein